MKSSLKGLQARVRGRWHLTRARLAIARCNRAVARRKRLHAPAARPHYFAPGVIEAGGRRRRGLRPYVVTLLLAIASVAFFVVRGGLPA